MRSCGMVLSMAVAAACSGGGNSPASPSPATRPPQFTAPIAEAPADDQQMDSLRPVLTIRNGTSDQTGTRTYEFQISDNSTFASVASSASLTFAATVARTGVPEDPSGKTSFTPEQDLQPATRFYWRARLVQGSSMSEWSAPSHFRSKLVGIQPPGRAVPIR